MKNKEQLKKVLDKKKLFGKMRRESYKHLMAAELGLSDKSLDILIEYIKLRLYDEGMEVDI